LKYKISNVETKFSSNSYWFCRFRTIWMDKVEIFWSYKLQFVKIALFYTLWAGMKNRRSEYRILLRIKFQITWNSNSLSFIFNSLISFIFQVVLLVIKDNEHSRNWSTNIWSINYRKIMHNTKSKLYFVYSYFGIISFRKYERNCKQKFFKTAISKLLASFSRVSFIGWKNKYQIVLEQIMKNDLNLI
jgi:hypothetical protein